MSEDSVVPLTVPDFGGDATEVTIVAWLKWVGEPVEKGEPVLEVMTDKANVQIESPVAGLLIAQLAAKDSVVKVGSVVGRVSPQERQR